MTTVIGSRQGINAMKNGIQIGGSTITSGTTITSATDKPNRKGDVYIDITAGKLYVASGTSATTDWKLVTSA